MAGDPVGSKRRGPRHAEGFTDWIAANRVLGRAAIFVDPVQSRLVDVLVLLAFEKMGGYGWWQYTRVSLKRGSNTGAATSIYGMGPVGLEAVICRCPLRLGHQAQTSLLQALGFVQTQVVLVMGSSKALGLF